MIEKFCIIIDDNPQDEIVDKLIAAAKKYGIKLECVQLDPTKKEFFKNEGTETLPEYVIDLEKVIERLNTSDYLRRRVDVIVCDYNLEDDRVNGFEIIRSLRYVLHYKRDIILYSGNLDNVIRGLLTEERDNKLIQKIKNLTHANISEFLDRSDYIDSVLNLLRKEKFSLESELESLLYRYGDWKFESTFPKYKGMKFKEIAEQLKTDSGVAIEFQKIILQFVIAQIIDINREING